MKLTCVLFDLDGTLLDTAPDLICSLNRALQHEGLPEISPEKIKPYISYGGAEMVRQSLNGTCNASLQHNILQRMLTHYQAHIAEHTDFYPGMASLLQSLENKGIKWGVVTNKKQRFTNPLMKALKLTSRAACIVSGDSTTNPKPHPEPMLTACTQAGVTPDQCLYIGDSANDIKAGKNVGMKTIVAAYGYLKPDDDPNSWHADALIQSPAEILPWLKTSLCY